MPKPLHDLTAPTKYARLFDTWFFQQTKADQATMRANGVLPFREAVKPRHIFEVKPNAAVWNSDEPAAQLVSNVEPIMRTETDAFITRDHVRRMLRGFIDALALSGSFQVRRHVELTRWALELPGRLPAKIIANMYGITKQAVHKRAYELRDQLSPDALGGFRHARKGKVRRDYDR